MRAQQPEQPTFGFEQRVRNENWNNLFDYNNGADDQRNQIRYRTRVWGRFPLGSNFEFNVGLNSESNQKLGQNSVVDELVFETLNLKIKKVFVKGLSLSVGRQDLMRGDGLVLLEGTSGDGSRSTYFNAVDLAYEFGRSKIEAIGILDPKLDRMLPRINDQHKFLQDWDEQALGAYYTGNVLPATTIEAYFFHKKEIRDRLAPTNPQFQPDRRIETAGARLKQRLDKRWTVTAEFAEQWGVQHPTTPIHAWAGSGVVKRQSDAKMKPYVLAGFYALSGDDPSNPGRISGWDPLFARWPRWGDLELYSQVPEKGVGYSTNQLRWQAETGFNPAKWLKWTFTYYKVGAFYAFGRNPAVFGTGTDRGNNLQTRLDYKINDHVRGHIDYETLLPGSYYAHSDRSYFLRFEMIASATATARSFAHLFAGQPVQSEGGATR